MESLELQFQWIMAIVANINQIEESTNQSVATILCFADFFLVLFLLSFVLYWSIGQWYYNSRNGMYPYYIQYCKQYLFHVINSVSTGLCSAYSLLITDLLIIR